MKTWLWCIPMLLLISPVVSAGEAQSMEELGLIEEPEKPVKKAASPKTTLPATKAKSLLEQGMWRDPNTNMIWMRCGLGQTWNGKTCVGQAKWYDWDHAQQVIRTLNSKGGFAGHQDWRLPHVDDLASLINCESTTGQSTLSPEFPRKQGGTRTQQTCAYQYDDPHIESKIFPNAASRHYWSSTPCDDDSNYRWYVDFDDGAAGCDRQDNYLHHPVRLVRSP